MHSSKQHRPQSMQEWMLTHFIGAVTMLHSGDATMSDIIEKLQSAKESDPSHGELLEDAMQEIVELRKRRDALEEILIILVRTGLPWDETGQPTESFPLFKERYANAMHEASELLGLELRSTITRTEPRT